MHPAPRPPITAIINSNISPGTSNGTRYQLSPTLNNELDDIWKEQNETRFGFKDYEELRQALRELHVSSKP